MKLALPIVWDDDKRLFIDADGNSLSPPAIINRLNIFDDLVRAIETLNHFRPQDMPAIGVIDIDRTLLKARALRAD